MKTWVILITGSLLWVPFALGSGDVQAGAAMFGTSCKTCHGSKGEGNPAIAKVLKTELQNLGGDEAQGLSDEEIKTIITAGKGKMKPVKTVSGKQLDDVIAFVRSLKKP
jgi:mono/diheme cytochrome c family protein